MSSQTVALVPTKSDSEIAKELKGEVLAKLEELSVTMDKAYGHGFEVAFQLGRRWDNKHVVNQLTVAKHF